MGDLMLRRRSMAGKVAPPDRLSWKGVWASIAAGTYASDYELGESIVMPFFTYDLPAQIVAFDTDELSDGSGKAHITFLSKYSLRSGYALASSSQYTWASCKFRSTLRSTTASGLGPEFMSHVLEVNKYTRVSNSSNTFVNDVVSADTLWIPSAREIFGTVETQGPTYTAFFPDAASRIRLNGGDIFDDGTETPVQWRLRSWGTSNSRTHCVTKTGGDSSGVVKSTATDSFMIIGFCM